MNLEKTSDKKESTVLVEMPISVYETFFSNASIKKLDLNIKVTKWDRSVDLPYKTLKGVLLGFLFLHKGKRIKLKFLYCISNSCHKEIEFMNIDTKIENDYIDIPDESLINKYDSYLSLVKYHDIFYAEVID